MRLRDAKHHQNQLMYGNPWSVKGAPLRPMFPANSSRRSPVWLTGGLLLAPLLGLALVVLFLAMPRAIAPGELPRPVLEPRAIAHERALHSQLVAEAYAQPLPFEVRAVGEAFRVEGQRIGEQRDPLTEQRLQRWRHAVERARAQHGPRQLLILRAVQAELFLDALAAWERTGRAGRELRELGGDFVEQATLRGWWNAGRLDLERDERRALFVARWTELAGLTADPLLGTPQVSVRLVARLTLTSFNQGRLGPRAALAAIERLAPLDRDYPAELARGLVLARQGDLGGAAQSFERQLQSGGDGPWALRTRNHLTWALRAAGVVKGGLPW